MALVVTVHFNLRTRKSNDKERVDLRSYQGPNKETDREEAEDLLLNLQKQRRNTAAQNVRNLIDNLWRIITTLPQPGAGMRIGFLMNQMKHGTTEGTSYSIKSRTMRFPICLITI